MVSLHGGLLLSARGDFQEGERTLEFGLEPHESFGDQRMCETLVFTFILAFGARSDFTNTSAIDRRTGMSRRIEQVM